MERIWNVVTLEAIDYSSLLQLLHSYPNYTDVASSEPPVKRRKVERCDPDTSATENHSIHLRQLRYNIDFSAPLDIPDSAIGAMLQLAGLEIMPNIFPDSHGLIADDQTESTCLWTFRVSVWETEFKIDVSIAKRSQHYLELFQRINRFSKYKKTNRFYSTFDLYVHSDKKCSFLANIYCKDSKQWLDMSRSKADYDFLRELTPELRSPASNAWSPKDFYDSVYVPNGSDKTYEDLEMPDLHSDLFAYQKRSVQWMLSREGVNLDGTSRTQRLEEMRCDGWQSTSLRTNAGATVFVNQWLGLVTTDESLIQNEYTTVSGGILAEEMGLGKTVELLALVLKHRRDLKTPAHASPDPTLSAISATLIVAPQSIITQWESEIKLHAPSMRTILYPGIKGRSGANSLQLQKQLQGDIEKADIVLCSYSKLSQEIHFAREPPNRNMRHKRAPQHERLTSPLVKYHWWRVVLDECQMVESGITHAAEVALQIPRCHAWGASGTPLRKDPGDVYGLIKFLKLMPYAWSPNTWRNLLDDYQPLFKTLINTIVLRHTKHQVKDEIELPPQKRIVSTISMTQIEDQHYSDVFNSLCRRVGLTQDGAAANNQWDPNDAGIIEQLRAGLIQLRRLCLHPDILRERHRRVLGGRVEEVLRTVDDVLSKMTEQNELALRTEEQALLLNQLRQGLLLEHEEKTQEALQLWKDTLPQIQEAVESRRSALARGIAEIEGDEAQQPDQFNSGNSKLGPLRARLRSVLELEHMAQFFMGNAYYQLKENKDLTEPGSVGFRRLEGLEVAQYDAAKAIRVEMLKEPRNTAIHLIGDLEGDLVADSRLKSVIVNGLPLVDETGGIESNSLFDTLDKLAGQYNVFLKQVMEWRKKLIGLFSQPLVDQDADEIQGDEYEISTKEQDEAYVRMDIFRAAVTDLTETISGRENTLLRNELQAWSKLAREGKGHAPEIMIELLETRSSLKPDPQLGSIRGILTRLKSIRTTLGATSGRDHRQRVEAALIYRVDERYRNALLQHEKVVSLLSRDVNKFIDVQNARLEFYRQLQQISDLVAPWPEAEDVTEAAKTALLTEQEQRIKARAKVNRLRAKLQLEVNALRESIDNRASQARYLEHLKTSSTLGDERKCIICQDSDYEIGVLTACGHLFCKDCINAWLSSHSRCPQCRARIKSRSELHQITYKPQELRIQEEEITGEEPESSEASASRHESPKLNSIYSQISTQKLNEIKSVELPRNFSTKIDFIARHLIWLRKFDPGCKTVVFSQYSGFCPGSLSIAFRNFGIRYAVVGDKIGVENFKHDPNIECILMHAGSQASGMNLVNASHVILCEPLVNTALELQAIARVHRIGQHRPTTVWMYLIEGTVEKAIYDLSVERRLEHIGNQIRNKRSRTTTPRVDTEDDIQAADAEEMNDRPLTTLLNKDRRDGELVGQEDLWRCLFSQSRPRRDLPQLDDGPGFENDTA